MVKISVWSSSESYTETETDYEEGSQEEGSQEVIEEEKQEEFNEEDFLQTIAPNEPKKNFLKFKEEIIVIQPPQSPELVKV